MQISYADGNVLNGNRFRGEYRYFDSEGTEPSVDYIAS